MPARIQPPPKEWLEKEWLSPPNGKGRGSPGIAQELGTTKRIVLGWLKRYGISEDAKERMSKRRKGVATWRKQRPSKAELSKLYLMPPDGQGKTIKELYKHYRVSHQTIYKWLRHYGIIQPFSVRHSQRMAGEGNASYKDGSSHRGQINALKRSGKPQRCLWCGTTKRLQAHHVDHNITNGNIDNLEWLCYACNRLESGLWGLSSRSSYRFIEENGVIRELHIKFN